MRILVVTAGSRGDVAPYTGLGQRLQQAGHQVAIAAHGPFADLVRRCGLEHRPLPGDPLARVRDRLAAPSPEAARSVFADFLRHLGDGLIAATAAGTDLIVTAFGPAPLSRVVAEGFGIPSIGAYLVPAVPTADSRCPAARAGRYGAGREPSGRPTATRPSGGSLRRDPSAARAQPLCQRPRRRSRQVQARRLAGRSATGSVRPWSRVLTTGPPRCR